MNPEQHQASSGRSPNEAAMVGRPKKKRKRSKHKDEPFMKDGKLSRKGRTITCHSCRNIGPNKATCEEQGRKATTGGNNVEGSGSASRQAQQTEHAVVQDGSGRSGAGAVIGLSGAVGEGGVGDPGGAGVVSQAISDNGKFPMVNEEEVTFNKLAPMAEEMIMLIEVKKGLGGGDLRDYVSVVGGTDDRGKKNGDFVDMPSKAVEKRMDANVPDEIDGAKGEQVLNHVVKKGIKHCKRWYWNDPELENKWYKTQLYEMHLLLNLSLREELENELTSREELVVLQVEFADMEGRMQELMEEF
uniref:Zinc finger, SWIM-type n=1 Tax=Tanacetum cinerariifolium TaxID=118510 RepID=A0A6L2KA17_TANCI|nr:zinc finger, SWIM-type [Tanacetum cinerariifolium]